MSDAAVTVVDEGWEPSSELRALAASLAVANGDALNDCVDNDSWYELPPADEYDVQPGFESTLSYNLAPDVAAMVLLENVDVQSLGSDDRLAVAESWGRLASHAQAKQARALAIFASGKPPAGPHDDGFQGSDDISRFAVDEMTLALTVTTRGAENRLALALQLTNTLPGTLAAWERGELDWSRVKTIADRTMILDAAAAAQVEREILPHIKGKTSGQLRGMVDKAVIAADPAAANARHEEKRLKRDVIVRPLDDGMSSLQAFLCAEEAAAAKRALDNLIKNPAPDDPRDAGQRRADTFMALITGIQPADGSTVSTPVTDLINPGRLWDGGRSSSTHNPAPPDSKDHPSANMAASASATNSSDQPNTKAVTPDNAMNSGTPSTSSIPPRNGRLAGVGRPLVQLIVSANTIAGTSDRPAELVGYGSIAPELARRLAADATWQRILTDPITGKVIEVGRKRYRPPKALADYVRVRDRVCAFPTCRQLAVNCDLDHGRPFRNGGNTTADNLTPKCRRHHLLKHSPGWAFTQHEDGATTWTTPSGRICTNWPETYADFFDNPPVPEAPQQPPSPELLDEAPF